MTPIHLESDMEAIRRASSDSVWTPEERLSVRRDRWIGLGTAAVLHLALLAGGAGLLTEKAQYGLDLGGNGLEVDLIAAPAPTLEPEAVVESVPQPVPAPPATQPEPEAIALPEPEPAAAVLSPAPPALPTEQPVLRAVSADGVYGDGSAPIAGRDATTARATGAIVHGAQPHYLKNPPPAYPEASRRAGEQGLVILSADIDAKGRAQSVRIKSTSGYERLDQSALRAVKNWKFRPATLGGLPVSSQADIPVRFTLDA
ncbi:MAG: hypothetical protein MOGMAGMI_00124 [Candidatus Omnitrophica bacterium]|nr:hypothetical protein [Candidatus Omnitrophota bacterium]